MNIHTLVHKGNVKGEGEGGLNPWLNPRKKMAEWYGTVRNAPVLLVQPIVGAPRVVQKHVCRHKLATTYHEHQHSAQSYFHQPHYQRQVDVDRLGQCFFFARECFDSWNLFQSGLYGGGGDGAHPS